MLISLRAQQLAQQYTNDDDDDNNNNIIIIIIIIIITIIIIIIIRTTTTTTTTITMIMMMIITEFISSISNILHWLFLLKCVHLALLGNLVTQSYFFVIQSNLFKLPLL